MKRVYKYKNHVSKWYAVNVGDVLILKGKDGTVFDTVIITKNNTTSMCGNCPLSEDGMPAECMHYAFACTDSMTAISINKIMENL